MNYKGDLVVSRYNEDVSWLSEIKDYNIFLYNKGEKLDGSLELPNVGREGNTYLTHIINNYDNLGEWVFFTQGHPFDHVKDYKDVLREFPHKVQSAALKIPNEVFFFSNGPFKQILYSRPNGRPHHAPLLDMNEIWINLFKDPPPETYPFTAGAIFAVNRDIIKLRSLDFYKTANMFCTDREHGPWEFERLFISLFNKTIN